MEDNKNINKRMAKGAAWSVLTRLSVKGLGLISTLILARLLLPEHFGLVVLATTCVGVLEVMGEFGLDTILITNQGSNRSLYNTAWTIQVLRGVLIAAVLYPGAAPLAELMNEPELEAVLQWLALSAVLQGFYNIGIVEFRKELMMHRELVFLVVQKLISFCVTLGLAFHWRDYWALIAGLVTGHFAGLILSFIMSKYRPGFDLSEWRAVIAFSKWLVLVNILNYVSSRGANFVIGWKAGTKELGYYSVADEVASLPTSEFVYPIQRAVFPGFSKISSEISLLKQSYLSVFTLVVMLAAPLGVGIALVAEPMVTILLGDKWLPAVPLIEILAVSGAFRIMGAGAGSAMYALKKVRTVAGIAILNTTVRLSLLYWLASGFGAEGAAWAVFASTILGLCINLQVLCRMIGLSFFKTIFALWRTIISLGAMTAAVIGTKMLVGFSGSYLDMVLQLLVLIPIGAIAYIGVHLGLWLISGKPESAESRVFSIILKRS